MSGGFNISASNARQWHNSSSFQHRNNQSESGCRWVFLLVLNSTNMFHCPFDFGTEVSEENNLTFWHVKLDLLELEYPRRNGSPLWISISNYDGLTICESSLFSHDIHNKYTVHMCRAVRVKATQPTCTTLFVALLLFCLMTAVTNLGKWLISQWSKTYQPLYDKPFIISD